MKRVINKQHSIKIYENLDITNSNHFEKVCKEILKDYKDFDFSQFNFWKIPKTIDNILLWKISKLNYYLRGF